jgi:hypothetical protein
MKSMEEVERRSREISRRMKAIQEELRSCDLNPAQTFNLAEELVGLFKESQILDASVYQFRELAEQLLSARCSGPH